MTMYQIIIFLAGLGLFFSGLHLVASSMQPLASSKMRSILSKMVSGPLSSMVAGSLLGAMTQSTSAAAFICIGLLNSGALGFYQVLDLIAWSSVGTSILVFLASIDVRMAGMSIFSLVGIGYLTNIGRYITGKQLINFLFALGVLFLGLGLIKDVSIVLRGSSWALEFIEFASEAGLIAFLIGIIVTFITQSSSSVTILAVTLNSAGVLPFFDSILLVCGSSIGSGLSIVMVSSHLHPQQRQVAIFQCLIKILGAFTLLPFVFLFEEIGSYSIFDFWTSTNVGVRIAIIYLALQVMGAIVGILLKDRLIVLLEKICPLDSSEELFEPIYIYPEAADDPETAIILATKEQDRLLIALPDFIDSILDEIDRPLEYVSINDRHSAATRLAATISDFLANAVIHKQAEDFVDRIFALQSRNEMLISLQDTLQSFVTTMQNTTCDDRSQIKVIIDSLHMLLIVLSETIQDENESSDLLLELTFDRGDMMEKLRLSMINNTYVDTAQRQSVFISSGIFERIVWLIRKITLSRYS